MYGKTHPEGAVQASSMSSSTKLEGWIFPVIPESQNTFSYIFNVIYFYSLYNRYAKKLIYSFQQNSSMKVFHSILMYNTKTVISWYIQ